MASLTNPDSTKVPPSLDLASLLGVRLEPRWGGTANYWTYSVSCFYQAAVVLLELRNRGFYSFRGQRDKRWYVGAHDVPEHWEDIFNQFVKRCREIPSFDLDENDFWRCLFYAQHFGIKTKLVDWTTNPLVALYFAVENIISHIHDDSDIYGAVWAIRVNKDPKEEAKVGKKWYEAQDLPGYGGRKVEDWRLGSWVLINPPLITDRLIRQCGKFSYHPAKNVDDLTKIPLCDGEELVKVEMVPAVDGRNPTAAIRKQLGILNIHHASLFPSTDDIAKFLNTEWVPIAKAL